MRQTEIEIPTALRTCLILLLVGCGASIVIAGWISFWTDSEIWNTVVVKYLFSGRSDYDFGAKPLFNVLLWLNFRLAEAVDVHPMSTARVFFVFNSAIAIGLFYGLTKKLSGSALVAGLLSLLLASDSFFIMRFSNVRSDELISTLMLGLFFLAGSGWWKSQRSWFRLVLFALVSVVGFLITPKSALWCGPWGLIFLRTEIWGVIRSQKLLAGIIVFGGAAFVLTKSPSFDFFLRSFSIEPGYFSMVRLEYVERFLAENSILVLLFIFNLWWGFLRRSKLDAAVRSTFDFANWALILLILFPERLPFFIAALLPFFFIPFAAAWPELKKSAVLSERQWRRITIAVFCLSLLSAAYWCTILIFYHNSTEQRSFIAWLDRQALPELKLKIFDPVGLMPFSTVHHWFLGPAEPANEMVFHLIKDEKTDIVFYTKKLFYLGPEALAYLKSNYVCDVTGICVRKFEIFPERMTIEAKELVDFLEESLPQLRNIPNRKIFLQLKTSGDIDLSRYAVWQDSLGEAKFTSEISIDEIMKHRSLKLPPTISTITMTPVHFIAPISTNLMDLFRFDTEF